MELIDLVKDVKENVKENVKEDVKEDVKEVNTKDSGNVSTLQASMLSVLTDEAIVHSQKKVSSYCVPFASEPLIQQSPLYSRAHYTAGRSCCVKYVQI